MGDGEVRLELDGLLCLADPELGITICLHGVKRQGDVCFRVRRIQTNRLVGGGFRFWLGFGAANEPVEPHHGERITQSRMVGA